MCMERSGLSTLGLRRGVCMERNGLSSLGLRRCVYGTKLAGGYEDSLTLKAPITTAADDKFCDIFPNFRKK